MQLRRLPITPVLLCACLATTVACGTTDQPTDREYDEIAGAVAPLITLEFEPSGAIELASGAAAGDLPDWVEKDGNGSFEGTHAGFDWLVDLGCDGIDDDPLGDPALIDAISICLSADGWLELPHYAAEIHADKQWSVGGLQGNTLALEGTCQLDASSSFESPVSPTTRSAELAISGQHDLVIPRADPPAATGSIHLAVDAERVRTDAGGDQVRQLALDFAVTLDGSGTALIVIDGVAAYELDLRTGALTPL